MSYCDLIQRLFQANLFGSIKLGLKNPLSLQKLLHFPDRSFSSIHVAGTNGKGSVSMKIAHALEQAGYKVGLYTSPHLCCFRERIQINGKMISKKSVESLLSSLFTIAKEAQIPATFFELTTFLGFLYFAAEKVDIAVIEAGLGGRLDATNVLLPALSIITSISLDHTSILGNTTEEIAQEKGGIIKEKVPVIIGPNVPLKPIEKIAFEKGSPLFQVPPISSLFEEENRSIAQFALQHLSSSFTLSPSAIQKGIEKSPACRFQIVPGSPIVILDVAHNPNGLENLFQMCKHHYPNQRLRLLFGLSKNKDLKSCLKIISYQGTQFHLVEATNGRGASVQDLSFQLQELSIPPSDIFLHSEIAIGVQKAKRQALKEGEILLIFGSFFIMKEARKALGFDDPSDEMDLNERF